jgi:hypothetical protein
MKAAVTDTFPEPNRRLLQRFAHSYYAVFPLFLGYQDQSISYKIVLFWLVADSW